MIALSALVSYANAQNLVVNPSFEERIRCPNNFSASSRDFNLPGWKSANAGTPDYFNQCSWGDCDVPFNWAGESNAHSGVAYAGIYVWNRPTKKPRSYREYIEGELLEPLRKGKRYRIEFYYKLATYSVYTADRIGLLLTDSSVFVGNDQVIERVPNLSWIRSEPITSGAWELATVDYTAKGGEHFFVIGNFFDNLNTQFNLIEYRKGKSPMLNGSAYFYIDDVAVTPLDPPDPKPLVWADGEEVKPEEIYVLKNIQFEFDKFILWPVSFPELDKLVAILEEKSTWKAELTGHTDDIGSDEYNLELSRNRAMSVGQYLVSKGIVPGRLSTQGFGKQRPLVPAKDENARALNRRVEVRFLK
jgi:outer membrane protein OmpA-like peptidoglycan-associated protein